MVAISLALGSCVSGSWAMPAAMAASSAGEFWRNVRPQFKVKILGIAKLLPVVGFPQADDSALGRLTIKAVNEHNAKQAFPGDGVADLSGLPVVAPGVWLAQQRVPFQPVRQRQRHTMFCLIARVLARVKRDSLHQLL